MKEFEKWYAAYDRTYYDACPEEAWKAALEWAINTGGLDVDGNLIADENMIKKELKGR